MKGIKDTIFKIERGIPIPARVLIVGKVKSSRRLTSLLATANDSSRGVRGAVRRLSKGSSFLVPPNLLSATTPSSIRDAGAIYDVRLVCLVSTEGARVWRVCNDGSIPQPRAAKVVGVKAEPAVAMIKTTESPLVLMANNYSKENALPCLYEDESVADDSAARRDAFIAGAEWAKESVNHLLEIMTGNRENKL